MRYGTIERKTKETEIRAAVKLDGKGEATIDFPNDFFRHMLETFTVWGRMDIELAVSGDTWIDFHHAVEDTGIVLGKCLANAFGDKRGFERTSHAYVPMDESLVRVVADISGRSYYSMAGSLPEPVIYSDRGNFQVSLIDDFWIALCGNAGITLHVDVLRARSSHHAIEALFKAAGKAFRIATRYEKNCDDTSGSKNPESFSVLSTKGVLE